MRIRQNQLFLFVGLGAAGLLMLASGFDPLQVLFMLGLTYLLLRFATAPVSLLIARIGYSIRLKFEVAIGVVAALVLAVGLISFGAMDFMHQGLHDIQDIGPGQPFDVLRAVDELEDTQHGALFTLMPVFSVLGVIVAATLGAAMAWSVIDPVRRMEGAMQRIASGEFAEPVEVVNRDELGELATQINQTAVKLARLQEETVADERSRALKERIAQVVTTQEEERRRISRELHDGLGPSLAAIGNRIRVCRSTVRNAPDDAESELDDIAHGLTVHIQEIRTLIHDLRPVNLDQLGLVEALSQHVERFGRETGTSASFNASDNIDLSPLAEVTVFRLVQECLGNIQKHAEASEVDVRLQTTDRGLEVTVRDDGNGFDPAEVISDATEQGMGLSNMRERAEILNARLSVESRPGNGCHIRLSIPLKEA